MKNHVEIMLTKQVIKNRIIKLGHDISEYYKNSNEDLILVGLLRGSFIFIADLCREVIIPHKIDFMTVSSYDNNYISENNVKIRQDLTQNITGKHVLIVEDIIDSGFTLKTICEILMSRYPKSLLICTLLDKPTRREVNINPHWVGFLIPDEFVVGYGIDYAQCYRHLPYVGKIKNIYK
ncbi:MAG: hypoxanthine phosphoribosyltransferase [Candidatus Dasytiphilus stammeri]